MPRLRISFQSIGEITMEIKLTPCSMDRDLFLRMAKDYINTLHKYDSEIIWERAYWESRVWRSQFIMEDRTVQGFVLTEIEEYYFFPDLMYIGEFYVVPEARRRGIGMAAVKAILKQWSGDLYFYVLDNNTRGKLFWSAVEAELGWKRIERPEVIIEEGCETRVFAQ